jgi:hypothetical protein
MGARAALVKGGHLEGDVIIDVLATRNGVRLFTRPRIRTRQTHGTGCTLASAIAALLAQGLPLDRAVEDAGDYLHEAIRRAPGFGEGSGPVNHGWPLAGEDPEPPPHTLKDALSDPRIGFRANMSAHSKCLSFSSNAAPCAVGRALKPAAQPITADR